MDAAIIGNPNSGKAGSRNLLEDYAKILSTGGIETEVLNTEYPDHATELATEVGKDRLVIAAGGDGTINEVINGLHEEATLGILPLGTANVLARELDLPLNAEKACQRILVGEKSRMDLGLAINHDGMERRFTFVAGIGFDANVIYSVTPRLKRYFKALAFVPLGVQGFIPRKSSPRSTCVTVTPPTCPNSSSSPMADATGETSA